MGVKVSSSPTTPLMPGTRKGNASPVEESIGDVTIGPETYDESVKSGMKAAAFASSEFVQQRILEHQKVLVAATGAALYSSLALFFAAVAVGIGILCVVHRTSQ